MPAAFNASRLIACGVQSFAFKASRSRPMAFTILMGDGTFERAQRIELLNAEAIELLNAEGI